MNETSALESAEKFFKEKHKEFLDFERNILNKTEKIEIKTKFWDQKKDELMEYFLKYRERQISTEKRVFSLQKKIVKKRISD